MERKNVAIIGAGLSGLIACKYLLSKAYSPVVFEAKSSIGGVWRSTLETTKLQTPKPFYQFSDFPWPDSVADDFPTTQQVMEYLHSYASHFCLFPHIRFNCKVTKLSYEGHPSSPLDAEIMQDWSMWGGSGDPFGSKGKWNVTIQDTLSHSTEEQQFEFVILCLGRFSDVPNIPDFHPGKGPEVFKGQVIHFMDYSDMDNAAAAKFIKAKNTIVVGFGKTAMDIAMECSVANGVENPCTMIYRKEHWRIPDFFPWGVPMAFLYFNRFSEYLVHKPEEGYLLGLLATLLSPLRWGISKFVETYLIKKHNLTKFGMVPKHSFLKEISSCVLGIVPEGFYNRVEEGSIKLVKAQNFSFCNDGILIDDDNDDAQPRRLETDLVILCTGFRSVDKLKHIFSSPFFQNCIDASCDTAVPLYR